ncbi:MAG: WbqC family protein, partial [Paludibacteraceae bacterium]|nr:WbqC family protein [Paludibacteraceae bacterium]
HDNIIVEQHDQYVKQTYRNRCRIQTESGLMVLSIPVEKHTDKTKIRDICISYGQEWRRLHLRAMETSYNSTPFFEYYKDDIQTIYDKKEKYLLDFNMRLLEFTLDALGIQREISLTDNYFEGEAGIEDARELFHPKKETTDTDSKPYYQMFAEKFGFTDGLSIVDLLFNLGPESVLYLKEKSKKI